MPGLFVCLTVSMVTSSNPGCLEKALLQSNGNCTTPSYTSVRVHNHYHKGFEQEIFKLGLCENGTIRFSLRLSVTTFLGVLIPERL